MSDYILLLFPLFAGVIVAAINATALNTTAARIRGWVATRRQEVQQKSGWLNRYYLRPFYAVFDTIGCWTDKIQHAGLRSGAQITCYLYLLGAILYVTMVAAFIAIALIFLWLLLLLVIWILEKESYEPPREPPMVSPYVEAARRGEGFQQLITMTSSNKEVVEKCFGVEEIEIDDDGTIYSMGFTKDKIGFIGDDGFIYDTRRLLYKERIAQIDRNGNIRQYTETTFG